jgi:aryl-alcohol dehydrogenase-like predicted oxidoreductase
MATGVLQELFEKGALRAWGVSLTDGAQASIAIERGCQVLSLPYNLFRSKPLSEVSALINERRIGLLAHSVLSYGLLCGHWGADKTFGASDHRSERWTPDELRRRLSQLGAVRPLVGGAVVTMRAAAVRYVLANDMVSSAVLGPKSSLQLDQLVREAGKGPPYLPEDKLTALGARLATVGVEA